MNIIALQRWLNPDWNMIETISIHCGNCDNDYWQAFTKLTMFFLKTMMAEHANSAYLVGWNKLCQT